METRRKHGPGHLAARRAAAVIGCAAVLAASAGCALPRVRVLHDPLTSEEHLNLGLAYEQQGELEPALRQYEQAARGKVKSRALTNQGNVCLALGRGAEAERRYRRALDADAKNVEALNNLAWMLAGEGRSLGEAERLIRRALALNPQDRQPYEDTLRAVLEKKQETVPAP